MTGTKEPMVLAIGAAPAGWAAPASFTGLSGFPCTAAVANAGRSLHTLLNKEELDALKKRADAKEAQSPGKATDFAALATMKNKEDYYAMLGLQHLKFRATQGDIKKAYRQCVLKYHPDKMAQKDSNAEREDADDVVLAAVSDEQKDKELRDIPKPVLKVIEELMDKGKTDAQILANYQMQEFVEGNDVCPKGLENAEEKISRVRQVREGISSHETEADQAFKALSNAMATLSDTQKRRAYDSKEMSKDVDDSIPADKKPADDEAFFQIWRPVLERNARWAVSQPMPGLGSADTPMDEVLAMYDKWFNFESWRDFTLELEDMFDVEEASCREERRWMERQNKNQAAKLHKDETRRINDMIERCHKWDPRIIAYKEQLKNAKKAGKQAKYAERAALEEAAKKKAAEEAEAARKQAELDAVAKKAEKEQKEAAKKQLKRARKALREAATKAGLEGVSAVKIEDLCELCSIEESTPVSITRLLELADLVASIKGGSAEALPLLEREVAAAKGKSPVEEAGPGPGAPSALLQQLSAERKGDKDRKWSRDEMDTLHKALLRYPAGTQQRWDKIAEFVTTRSAAECQRKCAEMKSNFSAQANGMTADAAVEFERSKAEAAKGHGSRSGTGKKVSGTSINSDREVGREGITHAVPKGQQQGQGNEKEKDRQQAVKPVHVEEVKKKTGSKPKHKALSQSAAKQDEDEWAAAFNGDNDDKDADASTDGGAANAQTDARSHTTDAEPRGSDAATAAEAPKDSDPNEWTSEQQRALEKAMAEFKAAALDPKEKWKAIAERVPGRTDKVCGLSVVRARALFLAVCVRERVRDGCL